MNRYVFGESVQGATHKRNNNKECQDSIKKMDADPDYVIVTVADGHGSASCPYSKTGSEIAVNVFCSVMKDYYEHYRTIDNGLDKLLTFLNREGDLKVAQTIDAEWKRRVYKQHKRLRRDVPLLENAQPDKQSIYKMYGSTLLGLLITKEFIYAFQLGDGDISFVNDKKIIPVLEPDKILGVETHSLSKEGSWKKAISKAIKRNYDTDTPYMYMLTSDGMANSFVSNDEFYKSCKDYFSLIKENGQTEVSKNLKEWLTETSEQGCGDDISVMFVFVN